MTAPLSHIEIAGETFLIGTVDNDLRIEAHPHTLTCYRIMISEADCLGNEARRAYAEIAALLLQDHAPDITVDWLFENMDAFQSEALMKEFQRQALDLAAEQGVAGRA
jgi:hypothetical protein